MEAQIWIFGRVDLFIRIEGFFLSFWAKLRDLVGDVSMTIDLTIDLFMIVISLDSSARKQIISEGGFVTERIEDEKKQTYILAHLYQTVLF